MTAPFTWAGCGDVATHRVEVYSPGPNGQLHGSLDAAVYTCPSHTTQAVQAITHAGLTPYQGGATLHLHRDCGYIFRYPTATGGTR